MNERFENLMYHAGLTASGCWDKMDDYDHDAIKKFAELIVQDIINHLGQAKWLGESNGWDLAIEAVRTDLIKRFGVE